MKDIKAIDRQYVMNTYARFDLLIERGEGALCYDENGREYIDLTSGIGVNSLGYSDADWAGAVAAQAGRLNHTSNLFYTEPCALLAEKLCLRTGYDKVFFANSGAEANECAIKLARKYSHDKYGEGRSKVLTLVNSFHGRTISTLSATGQDGYHKWFFPFTEGFEYVAAGDIGALDKAADGACALIVEFVQGEGGVVALDKEFVQKAYDLCRRRDILFIADEVQTGMGRTGRLLASEHFSIRPDVTTLAKGLGGGLPIGAVLALGEAAGTLGFGMHGSTFGGNPIVCAGAGVVLDKLDGKLLADVERKGEYIRRRLADCEGAANVSGLGMMVGILPAHGTAKDIAKKAITEGLLVLTAKDRVRLLPPLTITDAQLEKGMDILTGILNGKETI